MRTIAFLAATAILLCAPFGLALAQNAPDSGTPAAPAPTTTPAEPAASAAPVTPPAPASAPAAQAPPASAPAPAAANSPAANPPATSAPSANAPAATTTDNTPKDTTAKDATTKTTKKKKAAGMTRRQEVEKSIDSGTVPSRYRRSVPKEYQQYIPFSKD